jgi:hypothetical protein
MAASCSDDDTLTTLQEVSFPGGLVATPATVVLTPENKYESVTTISWDGVQFPVDAPVTYALQIDIPTDTIGTAAWANAVNITVGEDVLSKTLQGGDLNDIALDLGLPIDVAGHLAVRVSATMDRTVYSNAIVLTVTPFIQVITQSVLYMPGQYQNWDPATASQLHAIDAGVFRGLVTFPAGALEFKFTNLPNWNEYYGPNGSGGIAFMADGNLFAPAAGSYQVTVDLNTLSYTLTPYSFGMIGTATPGGWDADTDLVWDHQNEQWTWTGSLVPGALKFRFNDAWPVNYGTDANGTTMLLDNQGAHNVTEAGNYTVTFSLDEYPAPTAAFPATATYSVTLN